METDSLYIGMDLGTTNIKAVIISNVDVITGNIPTGNVNAGDAAAGEILAAETVAMRYAVDGDKVEFDLGDLYADICAVVRSLVNKTRDKYRGEIKGVCVSSASGNTALLDAAGSPLAPAVSWLDGRQSGDIEAVMGKLAANDVHNLIGWHLSDMFPLAHLCMFRRSRPDLLDTAARIGMSGDYVNFRLCGEWAVDHSTATTFYLQDQAAKKWHAPYLAKLGIPEEKLPRLLPSGTTIGRITPKASSETTLPEGTPVVLGAFDHPSAARGVGITKEGKLLLSCGTSWVGFTPVRDRKRIIAAGLLCDPFLESEGLWAGMFSLPNIAERIELYIKKFVAADAGYIERFNEYAAESRPGAGGLKISLYDEPPDNISDFKKSDIARAIMENVAFLTREQIKKLADDGIDVGEIVMAGGPSQSPVWPGIVESVVGMPVGVSPHGAYAGAVGAALLASQ